VHIGHSAANLGDAEVVVVSTAIKKNNPELMAARERFLPVVRRAEMLAELMRFRNAIAIGGTHGKTTTTSMVATLLEAGGLDPNRDQWRHHQCLRHQCPHGRGRVDGCGGRRKRRHLPQAASRYCRRHQHRSGASRSLRDFDAVRAAFRQFVENVPFYGFGVMCLDHPEVQALVSRIEDRRVITYGENPQSDVRYSNHRMDGPVSVFDVVIHSRKTGEDGRAQGSQAADAGQAQCVECGCRHCGRPASWG
jgi:UDP-N-acetylmuramate--alanine ligase